MKALSDAAVAKIQAAPVTRVYKIGDVPAKPGTPYLTVAVSYENAEAYTLDSTHGVDVARVTTQAVSSSYDGASETDDAARGALLDQYLTAGGKTYGPGRLQVGSALVRDPDGGAVITITSTYLFRSEE